MLTPDKIKEKSFQTTGRGSYRAEDVDTFLDDVTASYEQMFKENGDLIRKISILAKKVEEYRADEDSLKLALLNAQKLADKIVADAKESANGETESAKEEADKVRAEAKAVADELAAKAQRESAAVIDSAKAEAEKIIAEANRQSNEILGNINRKVTHESLVYDMIQKEASEFKAKLVSMYREHINLINQLPEIVEEQLDNEESAAPMEETTPAEEAQETAEVYTEDAAPVAIEFEEDEIETEIVPEEEPEEISSFTEAEEAEEISEYAAEEEETSEPEEKAKPFKLDSSKIDFADEEDDVVEAPAPVEDAVAEDDENDGASSISFKNFFKKK